MRKITKQISLLVLLVVLSLSFTSIVKAQEYSAENGLVNFNSGAATIQIKGNEGQTLRGKKFKVYRLLNATNAINGESIDYSINAPYEQALKELVASKTNTPIANVTEYKIVDYINSLTTNRTGLEGYYSAFRFFVEELRSKLESSAADVVTVSSIGTNNTVTLSGLPYGYYIIDEVSSIEGTHAASSLCMVNTAAPNFTVEIKSDYPVVEKKIQEDDNKTAIGNDGWNDIGDYEIGQTVPYKFNSKVPNMSGYNTYFFAWHDKMDEALTFQNQSININITDGVKTYTLLNNEYTLRENVDQVTFKVEIQDLKAIVDREFFNNVSQVEHTYTQQITLTFKATLNEKAADKTGRPGFENDVRLEFSNDADEDGTGKTGLTPWDTVVCFTYKLDARKENENQASLQGAKFRLYSDADCKNEIYVTQQSGKYIVMNRDSLGGTDHVGGSTPTNAVTLVSDANGLFNIVGLDSGTYYLKEIEAPLGYRLIKDPIVLTITPTFTDQRNAYVKGHGATSSTLKELTATAHIKHFLSGVLQEKQEQLVTNVENGSSNLTVVNFRGNKLPNTGSSNTLILLISGSILMCGTLLTRRKKMI